MSYEIDMYMYILFSFILNHHCLFGEKNVNSEVNQTLIAIIVKIQLWPIA